MNKSVFGMAVTLLLGIGGGLGLSYYLPMMNGAGDAAATASSSSDEAGNKPLFYRNPMNPAITSPVPAKDEMGMDYIPVYADKPKAEKKPLFYRNPMNPAITSPVPAQDEMGMDYIPVYADDDGGSDEPAGTVKIDPVVVQNIGVRTVAVEQRDMAKTVRASGRITVDESRMARLHPRTEGWVEQQRVARIGDSVMRGDELLQVYSPQLVNSQQEYLLALENLKALEGSDYADIRNGARELVDSAYQRLRLLDMPEHEIAELRRRGKVSRQVSIESPVDGVVLSIGAREGQFIMPNTELYMLADLSKVWLLADVYEYELPWVRVGDQATARITGLGDRRFTGTVSYIYPYAEARTRTVKVRLEFDNPDGELKPDMFAQVRIGAAERQQALVIPSEAVVRSGSREQVFVVRGEGKYEPREVELGYSSDGLVEVRSGLKLGDRVVNSALFLIDSESKLREATAKMMEASQAPAGDASLDMGDMDMSGMDMGGLSMDGMQMDSMSMDGMSMDQAASDQLSMESMSLSQGEAKADD
ncbi:efflux RND transporter periplasmic adaptor subunit [Motiliproteus sediminis]|uniref:efflux RND transporter periplasmic adaptor subunit n=1 Tax=Motiliproteus sediminis TaxID=1468178 RepID=UPI001AEF97FB|nr:efflux RND transporter periplasmic adaptor subunit [Motiliproteus sediminis]